MSKKQLATREEAIKYGGLGNRFEICDMISQLNVMYDNINPKKDCINTEDRARLDMIKILILRVRKKLNYINNLSK